MLSEGFVTLILFFLLTITLHLYFFFPTFAVIVVFPGFFALTFPFLETVATFFFEDFQTTFTPAGLFFTFSFFVFPTCKTIFFELSLVVDFALTFVKFIGIIVTINANVKTIVKIRFILFINLLLKTFSFPSAFKNNFCG